MRSRNQWIALAMLAGLGGCFFNYDYAPSGGTGGATGGNVSSSGVSTGGSGVGGSSTSTSSGGTCTVTVCGDKAGNSTCTPTPGTPCAASDWASRYGTTDNLQEAHAIAMGPNNEVIIGGVYVNEALMVGIDGPTLNAASGNNSFLLRFSAEGNLNGLASVQGSDIVGLAVNSMGHVSAITYEDSQTSLLQQWTPLGSQLSDPIWTRKFTNALATAVAVGLDSTIYVLGQAGVGAKLGKDETGATTDIAAGMFVARYMANGSLTWAKPFQPQDPSKSDAVHGAAITINNGIWITGYFRTSLTAAGGSGITGNDGKNMFLVKLTEVDGLIDPMHQHVYSPQTADGAIEPASLSVESGNVYVVGKVQGPTDFSGDLGSKEDAAFMLRVDGQPIEPDVKRVIRSEIIGANVYGSRMTGVVASNGRLYVAGTYSGALKIDPFASAVRSPGPVGSDLNTPFIAQLDPSNLASLSFTPFPGDGESFLNRHVYFAAAAMSGLPTHLAIAGAWTNTLNFQQGDMTKQDLLLTPPPPPAAPALPNNDIFVAKFTTSP